MQIQKSLHNPSIYNDYNFCFGVKSLFHQNPFSITMTMKPQISINNAYSASTLFSLKKNEQYKTGKKDSKRYEQYTTGKKIVQQY